MRLVVGTRVIELSPKPMTLLLVKTGPRMDGSACLSPSLSSYANSGRNQFRLSLQMCAIHAHITLTSHSHKIIPMRAHTHTHGTHAIHVKCINISNHTRALSRVILPPRNRERARTHAHGTRRPLLLTNSFCGRRAIIIR